jgi:hypothetical protein
VPVERPVIECLGEDLLVEVAATIGTWLIAATGGTRRHRTAQ